MPESVDPKSILLLQYAPTCYHNPIFDRYYMIINDTNCFVSWRVMRPDTMTELFGRCELMSWRIFDVMTYFWRHASWQFFFAPWCTFLRHDAFLTSWVGQTFFRPESWSHNITNSQLTCFWHHGKLLDFTTCRDNLLAFLRHNQHFGIMTCFWCHDELFYVKLMSDELFGIMTCFWCPDKFFCIMTYFWHHNMPF